MVTDSATERTFAGNLDCSGEVVVYGKLPKAFSIPTPVGNYNPDWVIAFKEGSVQYVYFMAETQGSMGSMELRAVEDAKIKCAEKYLACMLPDSVVDLRYGSRRTQTCWRRLGYVDGKCFGRINPTSGHQWIRASKSGRFNCRSIEHRSYAWR